MIALEVRYSTEKIRSLAFSNSASSCSDGLDLIVGSWLLSSLLEDVHPMTAHNEHTRQSGGTSRKVDAQGLHTLFSLVWTMPTMGRVLVDIRH